MELLLFLIHKKDLSELGLVSFYLDTLWLFSFKAKNRTILSYPISNIKSGCVFLHKHIPV